ncbi:MAG: diguanylate cyclase [Pseudohongiella sp.]|nr:diguanylate cyclase [Pseudohongiella sp.]
MTRTQQPAQISQHTQHPQSRRQWNIRQVLLGLVMGCLLPGVIFTLSLFVREYLLVRNQLTDNLIATARAMVQTVDSQLFRALDTAHAVASYPGLTDVDPDVFYNWVSVVINRSEIGMNMVLSDRQGRQVINTLIAPEDMPELHDDPALVAPVLMSAEPAITPVFVGSLLQRPLLTASVPVIKNDEVIYSLGIGILPESFNPIIETQDFPDSWIVGIFDNTGTIVARSIQPGVYVGQKGSADYIDSINSALEGITEGETREGIPVTSVWSRSPATNWSVGIGIPTGQLEAELRRSMSILGSLILLLLVIAVILAWRVARLISDSVSQLKAPAEALGRGESVQIPPLGIAESAQIATALQNAAGLLRSREAELKQARASYLESLEQTVNERTRALQLANEKLEQLALSDVMTGLNNRNAANSRLRQQFLSYKRTGQVYAVLFLDIDHFKMVNDNFGHETGDQVLRQLGNILLDAVRGNDFVARFGGEEFLALLENCNEQDALVVAEKIRAAVAVNNFPLVNQITVSIGLAMVKADDNSEEEAVRRADKALYHAKADGRDCVRVGV